MTKIYFYNSYDDHYEEVEVKSSLYRSLNKSLFQRFVDLFLAY